jgi:hypothetical protein
LDRRKIRSNEQSKNIFLMGYIWKAWEAQEGFSS